MKSLRMPPMPGGGTRALPPGASRVTIIGASGAGKSRFISSLVELNCNRAYCLSAVSAPYADTARDSRPGSIADMFGRAVASQPYLRADAASELEMLCHMLVLDEFGSMIARKRGGNNGPGAGPTRLDILTGVWERVYPGNAIVLEPSGLLFRTTAGSGTVPLSALSQGEKTVLYYVAGALYAPGGSVVFVDSPSLFLHPTVTENLWNEIEGLRPDCLFVYDSVDVGFAGSRTHNACIWIRGYDAARGCWDYEVIAPGHFREEMFADLVGSRKPMLFIEGDERHSIDARLYALVFADWSVRPVGSCNKVIETTRTFNDMKGLHRLESRGIVDRDRRTDAEVAYLRRKSVMVPEVAEVENIFLLEGVVRAMAAAKGRNPDNVFRKVRKRVLAEFARRADEQALQHVRHRVKREVECRIDAKFTCITAMELHLRGLEKMLQPRRQYNELRSSFRSMLERGDYASVIRVFNHKPMLADCCVAQLLGYGNRDEYVGAVIDALRRGGECGRRLRAEIAACFAAPAGSVADK